MDGLIKGLVNAVLDGDERENENEERPRSRSTWSEVVSGEQDEERNERRDSYPINKEEGERRNAEWESVGPRISRRPQKTEEKSNDGWETVGKKPQWNRQETEEGSNDGWETVGKKPPRRHQQVNNVNWNNYKRPANEQDYSDDVDIGSEIEPSENELNDLVQACKKLWDLDINRLVPGRDYEIDCGEGKKSYQKQDMAEGSLFSWLSENVLERPTISRFISLLDNYNPHEGYKEQVPSQEKEEQAAFIEEISRTAPIKYLHKYLLNKGILSGNYQEFKRQLTSLWFDLYGRGGTSSCSSAFEHVFVGEIKSRGDDSVSGFHNWLQFYMEEAKGNVDYQGYIFPRRRGETPDSETQLLTIQFEWNGVLKSVSSTMIGVSPEFEIALYTLCFYAGGEDNHVELGPYYVNIKCYHLGDKLGSAFPISES